MMAYIDTLNTAIDKARRNLAAATAANNTAKIGTFQTLLDKHLASLAELQMTKTSRQAQAAEIAGATGLAQAQQGLLAAQAGQQIGQAQVGQEGAVLQSQRDLEAAYRAMEAGFGGRDMLRSGVYQSEVARGEESNLLERAQIVREYSQAIQGLQQQVAAGANAMVAQIAAERARIKAAYALARLQWQG